MVTSYLQLLDQRYRVNLDESAQEFIRYAVNGALRMKTLINDLLVYSRVGTRGGPFTPVDLEKTLRDALQNLEVAIAENQATITHDPLPTVAGDAMQLLRLLQNLLGNAIKFRREEPPRIHVQATSRGGHWLFSIRDNGIGIDPQYYTRIFQVFQRLHTREQYAGTGIGLAVCKRVVERHGGSIWVESKPGEGSTFYFTLPARA
jgi:light-regulated signal transduction histidine kinase (bacteriophytochrome)